MGESFVSVSDAAKECGVSVQAMRAWCSKNNVKRDNGRWSMTDQDLGRAREYYLSDSPRPKDGKERESDSNYEAFALKQLEILQKQLEEKDRQISELQTALNTALETNKGLSASNAVIAVTEKRAALGDGTQHKRWHWPWAKG